MPNPVGHCIVQRLIVPIILMMENIIMAKIAISWNANLKDDSKPPKTIATRTFSDVTVNLFDTYKENVEFYGEDFIQDSITGTSILVAIQNALRTESLKLKGDKDAVYKGPASWLHTVQEMQVFALSYRPELNQATRERAALYAVASAPERELMDEQDAVKKQKADLDKRLAVMRSQSKSSAPVAQPVVVKNRKQS